jgi:hypothetical protein
VDCRDTVEGPRCGPCPPGYKVSKGPICISDTIIQGKLKNIVLNWVKHAKDNTKMFYFGPSSLKKIIFNKIRNQQKPCYKC